ncbi:carboxypeptidase B1-like [Branchiostoma floridae x Branchiostoma japonicum]
MTVYSCSHVPQRPGRTLCNPLLLLYISLLLLLTWLPPTQSRDVKPVKEKYLPDYTVYHNLTQVGAHIQELAQKFPAYLRLDTSYRSRNGRPQYVLRVSNFSGSYSIQHSTEVGVTPVKARILLAYGEHAREFFPVESMFHLLLNLTGGLTATEGSHSRAYTSEILSKIDLFIVGIVNPDGRHHVEQTKNYCWRGTSTGVDLNRNFDWQFGGPGSSGDPEDEEYRGSAAFSEPECLVLTDLVTKFQFDAFLSLHSGTRDIYLPFSDSQSKHEQRKPKNLADQMRLAKLLSDAMVPEFQHGIGYELNQYTADGTSFDYMAGVKELPFSLAVEMWGDRDSPSKRCFDLFNPPNKDLQTALDEVQPLYETLFSYLSYWKERQARSPFGVIEEPSMSFMYFCLSMTVLFFVFVCMHRHLPSSLRAFPKRRVISINRLWMMWRD